MSRIGRELQMTLQSAFREAVARRHAYLTLEHLLFAILHDDNGVQILRHSGAQVETLKAGLERFFQCIPLAHSPFQEPATRLGVVIRLEVNSLPL